MSLEHYIFHQDEGEKPHYGVYSICDKCGNRAVKVRVTPLEGGAK